MLLHAIIANILPCVISCSKLLSKYVPVPGIDEAKGNETVLHLFHKRALLPHSR